MVDALKNLLAFDPPHAVAVALRALAASIGAYAVVYEATAVLSLALPVDRVAAAIISTNLAFALMVGLVIWSFACRSLVRLWTALTSSTLILLLAASVLGA